MKIILILFFTFFQLFAINPIMLPITGVPVEHTYSNGTVEKIVIEREVDGVCLDIPIQAQIIQAGNLASKNVDEKCKKTFVTTKGIIQPFELSSGVKTVGELEVLQFIANKSSKEASKYVLVDSRKPEWFDVGTIPSSVNVPFDDLEYDDDFLEDYKKAYETLGVKVLEKNKLDFSQAKTALFFCNGAWCAQSPRAIKNLVKKGYPKEKMIWYRGGITAWAGLSLTLTKNIEAK